MTGTASKRDMKDQLMGSNDTDRDRGLTIKINYARINYVSPKDGKDIIHLIDTPGHADFTFEVCRSLEACEGALLFVDASQGVEAQRLVNVYHALEANLETIPVLNKIDLPGSEPERVLLEVEDVMGLDISNAVYASGKSGTGIDAILDGVIAHIPPPPDNSSTSLRPLIFRFLL